MTGAVDVDQALLALKIGFLVLLYLFIWMIVRSATRDIRSVPQESIVLSAADAAEARARVLPRARLVVVSSPTLAVGTSVELRGPTPVGRAVECALRIDDDYVSSTHAVLEARTDGLWIEDAGSTNGTYVNGAQVTSPRRLDRGDVVRIGQTELQVEAA